MKQRTLHSFASLPVEESLHILGEPGLALLHPGEDVPASHSSNEMTRAFSHAPCPHSHSDGGGAGDIVLAVRLTPSTAVPPVRRTTKKKFFATTPACGSFLLQQLRRKAPVCRPIAALPWAGFDCDVVQRLRRICP